MGGLQKSGLMLARGLKLSGYSVELCLLYPGSIFFKDIPEMTIYNSPKQSGNLLVKWIQVLIHLRKSIANSNSNQVVVFGRYYGALVGWVMMFNRKTNLVISERNAPSFRMSKVYERFCDFVYALRPPNLVLAQTNYAAALQRSRYPMSKVVSFYNLFSRLEDSKGKVTNSEFGYLGNFEKKDEEIVFLVAGRFNDFLKGIPLVLEAFLQLKSQVIGGIKLLVAGGDLGEDMRVDEVLFRYPGWEKAVTFLGRMEKMDEAFAAASVFILPSNSEGFPNVLVEAMQHGLCCISAEFHSGIYEILEADIEGLIVPNGDIQSLQWVMKGIINGTVDVLRIGIAAKEKSQKFEMENRINEIKEVFYVD